VNDLSIKITISGGSETEMILHEFRNALAKRGPMHARMAKQGQKLTKDYLKGLNRHRTAQRLGGTKTRHYEEAAKSVEAQSDDKEARVVIPRRTGLGRAFGDFLLRPGSGRTYLTIPACAETYGKVVKDFSEDTFHFAILNVHRVFPVLLWTETSGRHKKGDVAYWLRREVKQTADRSLLPSDEGYATVARAAAIEYLSNLLTKSTR
jgi:hypothetical protein